MMAVRPLAALGGASPISPLACVMGSMDLVRPLGLAGIECIAVARPGAASLYSRFNRASLPWRDFTEHADGLVEALLRLAAAQPEPPVLFYEEDGQLLFVSRHRERLARAFRFVLAAPELVEDLVDKSRFQRLAERLNLPIPTTRRLRPGAGDTLGDIDLRFPLIVKPVTRRESWNEIAGAQKALQVDDRETLEELWPRLATAGMDFLAQELVPGPETAIESYHVYVDERGSIAGEFTGRKIRTYPEAYGHSTALVTTDAPDVTALGRAFVERLDLRGVAKFDFKRDPGGALKLLEVNPRFNLWHHLGAVAGVNLPALVYADLVGQPRPPPARARAGVRWSCPWKDLRAARASGVPVAAWLFWTLTCQAKSAVAWDDPAPLIFGAWSQLAPLGGLKPPAGLTEIPGS